MCCTSVYVIIQYPPTTPQAYVNRVGQWILYLLLAIYLNNILPNVVGARRPWYYPFMPSYWRPPPAAAASPLRAAAARARAPGGAEGEKEEEEVAAEEERMRALMQQRIGGWRGLRGGM